MKWENYQLKDIANYWTGKVEASVLDATNYISTENLIPDRGGVVNSNYVPTSGNANSYSENDVLISNIRPYFKKIWFADKQGGCSNDVLVFRVKENVEPLFLYYQLSKDAFFDDMVAGSNGTKMPRGNKTSIMEFKLHLPPLPTQRRIASILSAYDDLIENNLKRIKLLEGATEIVFKTEFAFFKPSNEVNNLPDGWKVLRADEIFRINIGKTPPREQDEWFNDADSGIKWVSIKDINNSTVYMLNTSETVTGNAVNKFNMNVAKIDTVILSFKLTVGKVAITTEEMVTNEAIAHFNIDDETRMNSEFIYFYLKNFPYDSLGSTSSIGTAINSKIVKAMPVLLPPKSCIQEFGKKVKPSFQMIKTLLKQNAKLREARDILLPRLMSGQIEV